MQQENYWVHSLTAFENEFVFPEDYSTKWYTLDDWRKFWDKSWQVEGDSIVKTPLTEYSEDYLKQLKVNTVGKKRDVMEFKKVLLKDIMNGSFPTFLAITILAEEFNFNKLGKTDIIELDINSILINDNYIFKLLDTFEADKPQIHQLVAFMIFKIGKILSNNYSKEEMNIDENKIEKMAFYIGNSVKMALEDMEIHKQLKLTHSPTIIEFEYDLLRQFLNTLTTALIKSIQEETINKKVILNEIGLLEEDYHILLDEVQKFEDKTLGKQAYKAVETFLVLCIGLKNSLVSEKSEIVQDKNTLLLQEKKLKD